MFRHRIDGAGQSLCTGERSVNPPHLALFCTHKTNPEVVVAIAGRIVVAIRRTQVLRVVVPAAATIHAVLT